MIVGCLLILRLSVLGAIVADGLDVWFDLVEHLRL